MSHLSEARRPEISGGNERVKTFSQLLGPQAFSLALQSESWLDFNLNFGNARGRAEIIIILILVIPQCQLIIMHSW